MPIYEDAKTGQSYVYCQVERPSKIFDSERGWLILSERQAEGGHKSKRLRAEAEKIRLDKEQNPEALSREMLQSRGKTMDAEKF